MRVGSGDVRLLQIYNQYRSLFGGEGTVVNRISDLVERHSGESMLLMKTSRGLDVSLAGKLRAFWLGMFNPFSPREVLHAVREFGPDVVHVHNLYPFYSPSVLPAIRRAGVPIVMTVHNQFLTCPKTDHLYRGIICEKCVGGREYHCLLQNCRGKLSESLGYALRSVVARKFRLFLDNISVVIALSRFARHRLLAAGFDRERVVVLPNMVEMTEVSVDVSKGRYAMFAGRISPEKGVGTLLEAAAAVPEIPVVIVGDGSELETYRSSAPSNVSFLGQLPADQVKVIYQSARYLVFPSRCFEGCPLVVSEAMINGLPVISSRIGGLPELVDDGVTGLLFDPGNAVELKDRMSALWHDPATCCRMGEAGRRKALEEYSEDVYWKRLCDVYASAARLSRTHRVSRGPSG